MVRRLFWIGFWAGRGMISGNRVYIESNSLILAFLSFPSGVRNSQIGKVSKSQMLRPLWMAPE